MAKPYKLGNRWACDVSVRDAVTGEKSRKRVKARTRAECEAKARKLKETSDQGLPIVSPTMTVADYMKAWLPAVYARTREKTQVQYEGMTRLHIVPLLGDVAISKLTPQHVERLMARKLADGKSTRTVRHIHTTLRTALADGVRLGVLAKNAASDAKPPPLEKAEVNALRREDAIAFMEAARGDPLEALWLLALFTGLRRGELLGLRWPMVDLERGELTVNGQLQRSKGKGLVIVAPKTRKSVRTIALPGRAVEALRARRAAQEAERTRLGGEWVASDLVFTTARGTPLDGDNMRGRDFPRLLEKAGLPPMRFHDLRHTAATLMLRAGVGMYVVQRGLGHSSITTTIDTYGHLLPDAGSESAAILERFMK
ncbi:MAG: site-specific integrase [Candidatus Methylomirabilis sp.]|nr:site-specific integrase [Deltaproteobacteria bacterium]